METKTEINRRTAHNLMRSRSACNQVGNAIHDLEMIEVGLDKELYKIIDGILTVLSEGRSLIDDLLIKPNEENE